jgi:hypothetical protein
MRSGPGWARHPDIKEELNPSMEDNGLCWVTKKEFFRYFPIVYVCAFNMTRLKDDTYVNDLNDDFKHRPKVAPKKAKPVPAPEEELLPHIIDKSSDPSSPYKVVEEIFSGGVAYVELNAEVVKGKSIVDGVKEFKANPEKYLAIHYQTNMATEGWPIEVHQFTYIYRHGTEGIEVDKTKNGKRTILINVLR